MKWSWNIGKIAGIDVKIHLTFFLLLIWVGFSAYTAGGSIESVLIELAFVLVLFLSVVLHELGHALTARSFGISTRDITLLPIGGIARLEKMPEDPKQELRVAGAGPLVNVIISGLLFTVLLLTGTFTLPLNLTSLMNNFWVRILSANLTLAIFNLIPAFPMDGGRVLRAFLATRMDHVKATQIAANVGRGLAVVMGIAGIFLNPLLVLTALFVWYGAGGEAQSVALRAGLQGLTVRDALVSQFHKVEANQPLDSVYQLLMQTGQSTLPVTSNGNFLGLIRRNDLQSALQRVGHRAPAYSAIGVEPKGLALDTPLMDVLPQFGSSKVLPVLDNRELIGLVTPQSIQQSMWLKKHPTRPGPNQPGDYHPEKDTPSA
jgi:Zn-dependent protease